MSNEMHQKLADGIAVGSIPANLAIWLADIDLLLRILVSIGSLVLIAFAIHAKIKHGRTK